MVETKMRNDVGPFAKGFSCGLTNVMLFMRPVKAPKNLQPHNVSVSAWLATVAFSFWFPSAS